MSVQEPKVYETVPKSRPLAKLLLILVILILLLLAGGYFFIYDRAVPVGKETNVESLVKEVGALIVLPAEETPTVATVTDVEKLKNQAFFAKAKVGYKVLIYTTNKKAILYDPFEKKIVEVGAINLDTAPKEQ